MLAHYMWRCFLFASLASHAWIVQPQPALQPKNITRADGESAVFIPCPYEFRPTPSIWKIDRTYYTAATIPSIYSITSSGLFINTVHVCLNQTSFQCVDTSDNALEEQVSDIGILTVTSEGNVNCTVEDNLMLLRRDRAQLELNHRLIQFGIANTTLAWKFVPDSVRANCSTSHVVSFRECQQNNVELNRTTEDETITLSSTSLQQSGMLLDLNLSSSAGSHLEQCPRLMDTVRVNVTETEIVNILLGNNNCTCVDVERRGGLGFALANPDLDQADIICRVRGSGCYSPATCKTFKDSELVPFFRACDNPSENTHTFCFSNVSERLSGSRLDLFISKKVLCQTEPGPYAAREYFRSFELNVSRASGRISVNTTSREICFASSKFNNCNLINLTQYNTSIFDMFGNEIFKATNIPESTCQTVDQLDLLPQCGPFRMSTRPFNDYIMYNPDTQQITSDNQPPGDHDDPKLCTCLQSSTQLTLTAMYNSQDASVEISGHCSSAYTTPVNVAIIIDASSGNRSQVQITCSNERFQNIITMNSDGCDYNIKLCGYFILTNGSTLIDCPLNCSNPVFISCFTTTTTPPHPGSSTGIIIAIVFSLILILAIIIAILVIIIVARHRHRHVKKESIEMKTEGNGHKAEETSSTGKDTHNVMSNNNNSSNGDK